MFGAVRFHRSDLEYAFLSVSSALIDSYHYSTRWVEELLSALRHITRPLTSDMPVSVEYVLYTI